jgi:hypothetical protein
MERPHPVVGWAAPAIRAASVSSPTRCRWEYLFLESDGTVITRVSSGSEVHGLALGMSLGSALIQAGEQEWELVAVHDGKSGTAYTFKRPVGGMP